MSRLTDYEACGPLRITREFHDFEGRHLAVGGVLEFDFYHAQPVDGGYVFSLNGETVLRLSPAVAADREVFDFPERFFALPIPRLAWYTNRATLPVTQEFADLDGRIFRRGDQIGWAVHERDQTQMCHHFIGQAGIVLRLDEQIASHADVLLYPERYFELPFDARPE